MANGFINPTTVALNAGMWSNVGVLLRTSGRVFGVFSTGSLEKASLICTSMVRLKCLFVYQITFFSFVGVWLLGIFTFTIGNIFFLVLDLTGKPSVLLRYKIQEDKGVPVSAW